jgi:hypothetical protein
MLQILARVALPGSAARPSPRMAETTCNFAISAGHSRGMPAGETTQISWLRPPDAVERLQNSGPVGGVQSR